MQRYNAEVYKNYMLQAAIGLGSRFILPWSLAHCVVLLVQTSLDGIRNLCKEAHLAGLVCESRIPFLLGAPYLSIWGAESGRI